MITSHAPLDNRVAAFGKARREAHRDQPATRQISLGKGGTVSLHLRAGESVRVQGRAGVLWVTMEGDRRDYVIAEGRSAGFTTPGLLVLQGLAGSNEAEFVMQSGH
jgi:hypothetical protein